MKKYCELKKNREYRLQLKTFLNESKTLFDIAARKFDLSQYCQCFIRRSVSNNQKKFLEDQRKERRMILNELEIIETENFGTSNTRNVKTKKIENDIQPIESDTIRPLTKLQLLKTTGFPTDSPTLPLISATGRNNSLKLEHTAIVYDRFRIANRAFSTAVLIDIGLITPENKNTVIDKSKIWRWRVKIRKRLSCIKIGNIRALYFDGRKDETLKIVKRNGVSYRRKVKEEHITLVEKPGSQYIGHVVPSSGKAVHALSDRDAQWFFNDRIRDLSLKVSPYKQCFGFVDGTVKAFCRPTIQQREVLHQSYKKF